MWILTPSALSVGLKASNLRDPSSSIKSRVKLVVLPVLAEVKEISVGMSPGFHPSSDASAKNVCDEELKSKLSVLRCSVIIHRGFWEEVFPHLQLYYTIFLMVLA